MRIFLIYILLHFIIVSALGQCYSYNYNSNNSGIQNYPINSIEVDCNDDIWIAYENGVSKFCNDSIWTYYDTSNSGLVCNTIKDIDFDFYGNAWFASPDGAFRKTDTSWTTFNTTNSGLIGSNIIAMEPDQHGGIWFSSEINGRTGGVTYFNGNSSWFTFTDSTGLVSNHINYIEVDGAGNVWFGSNDYNNPGITRFNGNNWESYYMIDTIPIYDIIVMETDLEHNLWLVLSNNTGVFKFDGNNWEHFTTQNSGLVSNYIKDIYADNYNNIWFSSFDGMTKYNGTEWKPYTSTNGLPFFYYKDIVADNNLDVYITTEYNGILKVVLNSAISLNAELNTNNIGSDDIILEFYSTYYKNINGYDSLMYTFDYYPNFYNSNIQPGSYYIRAKKLETSSIFGFLSSYYKYDSVAYKFDKADTVVFNDCVELPLILNLQPLNALAQGNGSISGFITNEVVGSDNYGQSIPNIEVILEKNNGHTPVISTKTDSTGRFKFNNIPNISKYSLYVSIPGIPLIETYDSIIVDSSNLINVGYNFIIDSVGIKTDYSSGIKKHETNKFKLYPIPVNDVLTIKYPGNFKFKIYNSLGKLCYSLRAKDSYYFNSSVLENGLYLIQLKTDNKTLTKKIIKE